MGNEEPVTVVTNGGRVKEKGVYRLRMVGAVHFNKLEYVLAVGLLGV
jgi:hypothetical protein